MRSLLRSGLVLLGLWAITAQAADRGLLWKLEAPSGVVSYLFGTMHTDDPRVNDYPQALKEAMANSELFMLEALPPRDPDIFYMKDQTNAQLLHEDELERVRALAEFHSMNFNIAMHMKPWLLAIVFDLPKPQSPYSQDNMLAAMARDLGKRVVPIEKSEEHFSVMDSFTIDEQIVMLRAVLKHKQEDRERDFETLINAYISGKLDDITHIDEKVTQGMLPKALWDRMRVKILEERNVRMTQRVVEKTSQQSALVTMGAAHLSGKFGVLDGLRQAGYKVTPVIISLQ